MSDERNVLGGELQPCGDDPVTGYYRDSCCTSGPAQARHLICVVLTRDFLDHQRQVGNDLMTPRPEFAFPGLEPGQRWCVVLERWLQSHQADRAAPVVMAATNERTLDLVPLEVLRQHAVDVPDDPGSLT